LQRGRRKWRCRVAATLPFGDAKDLELSASRIDNGLFHFTGGIFVLETELLDLVTPVTDKARGKWLFVLADIRLDRPVLASLERFDLELKLYDHA
jgi:hypothetical protein